MFMSGVDPSKVHFFDEASVINTTLNRKYRHAKKGQEAVEVQRYSSNCNYTVNLLHSRFGVDYCCQASVRQHTILDVLRIF